MVATILTGSISLFQACLSRGRLSLDWQVVAVVAIHNGGPREQVENYRSMNMTCILCEYLERHVRKYVINYLMNYSLLCKAQLRFPERK